MDRFTPYQLRARPHQTTAQLNQMANKQRDEMYSKWVYNQDRSKVIVIGVQPNGEFGLREYNIKGDSTEETRRLW